MNVRHLLSAPICRTALTITVLLITIPTSHACPGDRKFQYSDYSKAAIIFQGTVEQYTKLSGTQATIQFSVSNTLVGEKRSAWTAKWDNSTFAVPETWNGSANVIVGLIQSTDSLDDKGTMQVLQSPCTAPNLVEDNPANRLKIQKAVPAVLFAKP